MLLLKLYEGGGGSLPRSIPCQSASLSFVRCLTSKQAKEEILVKILTLE